MLQVELPPIITASHLSASDVRNECINFLFWFLPVNHLEGKKKPSKMILLSQGGKSLFKIDLWQKEKLRVIFPMHSLDRMRTFSHFSPVFIRKGVVPQEYTAGMGIIMWSGSRSVSCILGIGAY